MKRDQALENNWRSDLTTAEPHFDDERTIRSAQPVVPLNDVAKEKSRRKWLLVGAFVIASLLGSTVALALVRFRQPGPAAVATESNAVEEATEPVAQVPETEISEGAAPSEAQSIEETEPEVEVAAPQTQKPKRHIPATSRRSAAQTPVTVTIQTNSPARSGEAQLVGEWQERRQRRVNRRPQNHSDLFRIREIFEGPRRNRRLNN